ncbi:GNAT family N-acetyltransferase [Acidimangrovimonas sediminis]|uniref:GNAT family N-acetyltransferase n=1 Tax=Acidimangrovimonas sediminis TaxID=2056283 RepID=UPI000C8068A4|nr:GNAT family N-acetyltransferase [Acidimangrovimonas sediminis]
MPDGSEIDIRRGLAPGQIAAAAALYWQAFGGKLGRLMGPEARAVDYLSRVMRADQAFCALAPDGTLVGLAGFRTPAGAFTHGSRHDMTAVYGRLGAAWRGAAWRMVAEEAEPWLFQIEGLCVEARVRGRGVGRALVEALCDEALARGHAEVRLEVSDGNMPALALYRRAGFTEAGRDRLGPLAPLFGYRGATRMVRRLG